MSLKSKFKGCLLLGAIGDALGLLTERVKSEDALYKNCGHRIIDQFHDKIPNRGRFRDQLNIIPAGTYSDDTQLTLAVARSIQPGKVVDHDYFATKELPLFQYYKVGAGTSTLLAATNIQKKSSAWNNNFYHIKKKQFVNTGSNGVAMRIAPIALVFHNDLKLMKEYLFGSGIVTHGHPKALIGAMFYGLIIKKLLDFEPKDFTPVSFLQDLIANVVKDLQPSFLVDPDLISWEKTWDAKAAPKKFKAEYDSTLKGLVKDLKDLHVLFKQKTDLQTYYNKYDMYHKPNKTNGTNTVLTALYNLCINHKSPEDAIVQAVNIIKTDTDTIAGILGGMLGALYGDNAIPTKWLSVQDKEYILHLADHLCKISEGSAIASSANNKYITFDPTDKKQWPNLKKGDKINIEPLGNGEVTDTVTKHTSHNQPKKVLYFEIKFESGQTCTFKSGWL
ncbi:ADP-ribosylglycohydrolase family protein [bacterium]|nr:ADP-ribosylglycohydrolase family protein [bacterium]